MHRSRKKSTTVSAALIILLAASLACSLPAITPAAPTPTGIVQQLPTATPPPPSLPPALVESSPVPGAELPLTGDVTLYFNQPMDQPSVEAALTTGSSIGGRLTWLGASTVVFKPASALPPESDLVLAINQNAKALNGMALLRPVEIRYRTAGYLRSAQLLPEPGAQEIDPSSAVILAFNRPVVPLGGDPASQPPAFTLQPAAPGAGRWENTSTYVFYPAPALNGGQTYKVTINPDLRSTNGAPLQDIPSWSFTTALPRLLTVAPADRASAVPLDVSVRLEFNQRMDPDSVQGAFQLAAPDGQVVPGRAGWDARFTTFVFTPTKLLTRSALYSLRLDGAARSAGGAALGSGFLASFQTVGGLQVTAHNVAYNGLLQVYSSLSLLFSAPLPDKGYDQHFHFDPAVDNPTFYWDAEHNTLFLNGTFKPATQYTLQVDGGLQDRWGGAINAPFDLPFSTSNLYPSLTFPQGSGTLFVTPQDASLTVQAVNLFNVSAAMGSVSLSDFLRTLAPNAYEFRNAYRPADMRTWPVELNTQTNLDEVVAVPLNPEKQPLAPGIYWYNLSPSGSAGATTVFLISSNVHLTFKISASDVLVWATDLRTRSPVGGAPVTIFDEGGNPLANGFTGTDGVFKAAIPLQKDPYSSYTAVVGQAGADNFSLALSSWSQGVSGSDFNMPVDYQGPGTRLYMYTDRPIYRPGDTVYFRLAARQALNGRYSLPDLPSLPVKVFDSQGSQLASFDAPLSAYGTAHGEYHLFAGAAPGYYQIQAGDSYLSFQVADYRKPEIDLQVSFVDGDVVYGNDLQARVSARYFFDAPASAVKVQWAMYAQPSWFYLPDYVIGPLDTGWLEAFNLPKPTDSLFGILLGEGEAKTGPDGLLSLNLPTHGDPSLIDPTRRQQYTLEVTLTDETGQPVSARAEALVHPSALYIGLRADQWVGKAGQSGGYTVAALDDSGSPAGGHAMHADFSRVTWERQDPPPGQQLGKPELIPHYTPQASVDFTTSGDGLARLQFTPADPGVYQLSISSEQALTQLMIFASGPGEPDWPNLPNQRLRLTADQANYKAGQTANILIPNPFPSEATALLTVERGVVMRYQVISVPAGGGQAPLALSEDDSPNVYVSITLLGQGATNQLDFRQGYLELPVDPTSQVINVDLAVTPARAGPGEKVNIALQAHNAAGQPVQAEFSISVVDKAVLALADPNAPDIVPAFYGEQPLGVRTSLSLAAYVNRLAYYQGGLGGGGGAQTAPVTRQNFPDTAYWNAELVTDANGQAQASLTLPDSLTTWRVEARGLTPDGLVGQARMEIITTKDLLVRPVAPRFLVAGDHVQLAALVQNNTATSLPVSVGLQAGGLTMDAGQQAAQNVDVPAGGRTRLEWWATVQDVKSADLLFTARAGDLLDQVRLANGALPVLHYSAPQAFVTSGMLESAGLQLELVSLPVSYPATANPSDELSLELAPSLASALIGSLNIRPAGSVMCAEQVISNFLPNLETYRLIQSMGLQVGQSQANLESAIRTGLQNILSSQRSEGAWGWWQDSPPDAYLTSYALFALLHARDAGMAVPADAIGKAVDYLTGGLAAPGTLNQDWQLDRLAFTHFTLALAGKADAPSLADLYAERARLNPWAQALLALALDKASPGSQEALTLYSDLQAKAERSGAGASWQETSPALQNMHTTLSNSAVVAYALAQHDPASPLLADAIHYIMANRQANRSWGTTFSSAWSLLAISSYIKGTGELNASFDFSASLNGESLLNGQAGGDTRLNAVSAVLPAARLFPGAPNALAIQRGAGPGRLYYSAVLDISQPVEKAAQLDAGLTVSRFYTLRPAECPASGCSPLTQARVGQPVVVHLNLTVPKDAYYVQIDDYIPAGAEIVDTKLKTSQQAESGGQSASGSFFDPWHPLARGWSWWLFSSPQAYDDHMTWSAAFLPAGAYELTYTLNLLQAGEFRVLPAHAWLSYTPDVQGNSAGVIFSIQP